MPFPQARTTTLCGQPFTQRSLRPPTRKYRKPLGSKTINLK